VKPAAKDWPGEFLFALLMAISPIVGAIWVDPAVTKYTVLAIGVVMTLVTLAVGLRPVGQRRS
jgi:hypothetical protein